MSYDWTPSAERITCLLTGDEPDRVPVLYLAGEDIAARISGLTVKEMLVSSKKLAEISIEVNQVLQNDSVTVVTTPYCGPYEGLAFAKANGKEKLFEWKDYTAPFLHEGQICKTEKDIDDLQIPEHLKVEPWPTILEAMAIVKEETGGWWESFALSMTWSNIQMLRGAQAYIDVIQNPDLLLRLCEKIYASQMDYYKAYSKVVGDPMFAYNCQYAFNRHMLSFDDAWKFEGQFINRFCLETNLPLGIHNCGFDPYWEPLIEKHREEGVEVIAVNGSHPLDLDRWVSFREKYPEIIIFGASIVVNRELENGTPEDVRERVRQNIVKLGPQGRFAVCPVCCPPWRVSLTNLFAVREAAEIYGTYPMNQISDR